jgi:hypothetical protein
VLGLGVATQLLSTKVAVLGFGVALILVVAAVSRKLLATSSIAGLSAGPSATPGLSAGPSVIIRPSFRASTSPSACTITPT